MNEPLIMAMVGNPNSGKTTIFNALTGQRQHVANYPGVTVEVREGECTVSGRVLRVVDLPGTYSLDSASPDAVVARDYILRHPNAVVVQVMNAADFERHAFLTAQVVELGARLVLVLNMSDRAKAMGRSLDLVRIRELVGCEVVETVGSRGDGIEELKAAVLRASRRAACSVVVDYGDELGEHILAVEQALASRRVCVARWPHRWLAMKVLEGDREARAMLRDCMGASAETVLAQAEELAQRIEGHHGDSVPVLLAERRHGFAAGLFREVVSERGGARGDMTDRIDDVLTHQVLGIPLFLAIMYLVFYVTFSVGAIPMGWIESGVGFLSDSLVSAWPGHGPIKSLVIDGIIAGVGNVLVFVPNIAMLFLCISVIEDTGYMSRVAFITDRFMHKFGLHGKSVIPMIIGFGCSVPALMATRTIENRRDRLATMFVIPLMSCGARLPIYTLFIPAFFPEQWRATVLWSIYLTGVLLALLLVRIIRVTLMKGDSVPFVMELPPYRMPVAKGLAIHVWERTKLYLRKAGTVILALSIVMWIVTSYPKPAARELDVSAARDAAGLQQAGPGQQAEGLSASVAGRVGRAFEPITRPLGFDWRINTALIGGLAAKEVVVAQLGIIFALGEAPTDSEPLRETLAKNYSPLVGLCVMLFCLISAPCLSTFAVMRRESGRTLYAIAQFAGLTAIAYVVCLVVYQVGSLLGA